MPVMNWTSHHPYGLHCTALADMSPVRRGLRRLRERSGRRHAGIPDVGPHKVCLLSKNGGAIRFRPVPLVMAVREPVEGTSESDRRSV